MTTIKYTSNELQKISNIHNELEYDKQINKGLRKGLKYYLNKYNIGPLSKHLLEHDLIKPFIEDLKKIDKKKKSENIDEIGKVSELFKFTARKKSMYSGYHDVIYKNITTPLNDKKSDHANKSNSDSNIFYSTEEIPLLNDVTNEDSSFKKAFRDAFIDAYPETEDVLIKREKKYFEELAKIKHDDDPLIKSRIIKSRRKTCVIDLETPKN